MQKPEITIGEAFANAADQQARNDAVKAAHAGPAPTMAERVARFFRNRYVLRLRAQLAKERKLIAEMPAAIEAEKAAAQRDYGLRLKEIDQLGAYHTAQARLEMHRIVSKLARLGEEA